MNLFINWLQNNLLIFLLFLVTGMIILLVISYKAGQIIFKLRMKQDIKDARADAVKRSRAVLGGFAGEQMAVYLPEFPCNPADCRFVGKPVDYVGFPGASEGDEIKEILLIEVKTGDSQLSKRERQIRDCVQHGRVRYVEYRINL